MCLVYYINGLINKLEIDVFIFGIILLTCVIFALGPLVLLWSVSVIFDVNVTYDLTHWFAALLFGIAIGGIRKS